MPRIQPASLDYFVSFRLMRDPVSKHETKINGILKKLTSILHVHGFMCAWVDEYMGLCVHGCMCAWVHGLLSAWVYGFIGA